MLNGNSMAQSIYDAMQRVDAVNDPAGAMFRFQLQMQTYLQNNMEITLAFSGVSPAGVPEVIPSVKASIVFPAFVILPAPEGNTFFLNISNALKGGIINPNPLPVPIVGVHMLNPAGIITNCFKPSFDPSNESALDYMKDYCTKMVNQIKTAFLNPTPMPATHAAFTGTLSMVSIL